ncbi:MAG: CBS domain-containing protein [Microscillaceae bacterium]|nr:CBS domain-containing protein [Microscillaceae bacterium]
MKNKIKDSVESIMQKNIPAVDATEKVSRIGQIAQEHKIHYVPVMLNGRLLGIVNSVELNHLQKMMMTQNANPGVAPMNQTMRMYHLLQDEPVVVSPKDSVDEVARIFSEQKLAALPVLDNGKFVGIITANDVLDYFLNQN